MKAPAWTDYALYTLIAGLTFAQGVNDWKDWHSWVGVSLAMAIALKAK